MKKKTVCPFYGSRFWEENLRSFRPLLKNYRNNSQKIRTLLIFELIKYAYTLHWSMCLSQQQIIHIQTKNCVLMYHKPNHN